MKRIEYKTQNKSDWGPGAWQDEPDKIQWLDPDTALPCLIVRGPVGALCGYVGVTRAHPLYGRHYRNVDLDVHGGLTFSNGCDHENESTGICHVPSAGEPDNVWWFGFDCAHAFDALPKIRQYQMGDEAYRDVVYVTAECPVLAKAT